MLQDDGQPHWTEKYFEELKAKGHGTLCQLHFCSSEWDGLPICKHSIEFQYCGCFEKEELIEKPCGPDPQAEHK